MEDRERERESLRMRDCIKKEGRERGKEGGLEGSKAH